MELIKPAAIHFGETIGIFAPSFPAHVILRDKYLLGISNLKQLGFTIKEGALTKTLVTQGYRSGSPKARAEEFMQLIADPEVSCLMSVIGGFNSSSLLEYLDYDLIRRHPKVICGYSDITSMQLAILTCSGLKCFYGPAVVPSFGEPDNGFPYTNKHFLESVMNNTGYPKPLLPPNEWSDHFIDATIEGWEKVNRIYSLNEGWRTLFPGNVEAPVLPANLDTLVAIAGTKYFPDLNNCILMIEEMEAPFDNYERNLAQLQLMGVFKKISGLIVSKPQNSNSKGAEFDEDELLMECIGNDVAYPVITNFDCGHTFPMITLQQMTKMRITAEADHQPVIELMEAMVL